MDGFEDHPDKILGEAMRIYSAKDEGFRIKVIELNSKTMEMIPKIYRNDPNVKKMLEEFGKEIIL